ncbi:RHS repeat-associated core domain-containing protein [Pseudomonas alloputida]|uniref:RHS repeat-associated core domain-containing protein n=1 Tax=Pseudomonas TaxID=286 RepID=UPI003EEE5F89
MSRVEGKSRKYAYCSYGYRYHGGPVLLAFNGEFFDCLAQGYLLGSGYRLFSPVLGRFLSADQLSPFGFGGINAYAYCKGDPVNKVDPSGRAPFFLRHLSISGFLKLLRVLPKTGLTKHAKDLGLNIVEVKSHATMLKVPGASIQVLGDDRPYNMVRGESGFELSLVSSAMGIDNQLILAEKALASSQFHVSALAFRLKLSEQRLAAYQQRLWAADAELELLRAGAGTWV